MDKVAQRLSAVDGACRKSEAPGLWGCERQFAVSLRMCTWMIRIPCKQYVTLLPKSDPQIVPFPTR